MAKKIVISGYYGCDNFGDEAILSVLTEHLKQFNAEIIVCSKNPSKTSKTYGVNAIKTFDFSKVSDAIKQCDILISGGGSLLQDVTGWKSLFYYLWVIFTAIWHRKKVIIFAQGIGPIKNKFGVWAIQKLLKKCRWVSVRDDKSLFLLRGWGIKTDLVCDPLFDLKLNGSNHSNKVGIQLRSFKTLSEKLLLTLANRVALDFSDKTIEIYSFQDSYDLEVCKHFESLLQTINPNIQTRVVSEKTPKELIEMISELEYMIAMRFHAVLISLKYGIKTLAICYDEKVENIARDAKIPAVSMLATENYGFLFNQLKNLDKRKILEFANSKNFDWKMFDIIVA